MKMFFFLFIVLFISSEGKCQVGQFDKCKLLKEILLDENVYNVLGLEGAVNHQPHIRVTDLSGNFGSCESFIELQTKGIFVSYFVVDKISPTINTGHYRDLIIASISLNDELVKVAIYISAFNTSSNVNESFLLVQEFENNKQSGIPKLVNSKLRDWDENSLPVDYE